MFMTSLKEYFSGKLENIGFYNVVNMFDKVENIDNQKHLKKMDRKDYIDAYLDYLMVISIEDLFSKINFITSYGNRFEDPLRKDNFIKEMQPIYNKGLDKGIKHINNMEEICSIYKEKVTKLTSISNLHKAVKEENNL